MTDHTRIDLQAESAKQEIARLAKAHIETSNRSFGQHIRFQMARQLRIKSERVK